MLLPSTLGWVQGAKREREVSPNVPISPEAQTGVAAPPPAKRVRAPTPVAEPSSIANQDQQAPSTLPEPTPIANQDPVTPLSVAAPGPTAQDQHQAVLPSVSQQPAQVKQAQALLPGTDAAQPPQNSEDISEAAASAAAPEQQQHVARVAVTQQDPEHVQVKIEMPASVVHLTNPNPPQQLEAAQPAQQMEVAQLVEVAQPAQQLEVALPAATPAEVADPVADPIDVDMTEGAAAAAMPDAAQPEALGDDAEDGELPDADDIEAEEQEAPGAQLQSTPAAGDGGAAATAGQDDADGNASATGRKPIIFSLPGVAPASEPSPPVAGSQPHTSRPPSGTFAACVRCFTKMPLRLQYKYIGTSAI